MPLFSRSSSDRDRDRESHTRDNSLGSIPDTPSTVNGNTTPTRSFSSRLLRRKPSLKLNPSSPSSNDVTPPVPPLSSRLSEYESSGASQPNTASTAGDVFLEQQEAARAAGLGLGLGVGAMGGAGLGLCEESKRNGWLGGRRPSFDKVQDSTPMNTYIPRLPESHPFEPRNQVRPPDRFATTLSRSETRTSDEALSPPASLMDRDTPTPDSSTNGARMTPGVADWLSRQPSRGKLRSSSHSSAIRSPVPPSPYPVERLRDPPPPLRHSPRRINARNDRMSELKETSSTDESADGDLVTDGKSYQVSVACTEHQGEIKWEITIKPRAHPSNTTTHSRTLTPTLGKSTVIAPTSASSLNLSLALGQPTGKLVFIQFPTDVTPSRRRPRGSASPAPRTGDASAAFATRARDSTFGLSVNSSPSPSRPLGQPLGLADAERPMQPPALVRPETPPPRMETPPPLPATPLSDVRTPRRGHARSGSRNTSIGSGARALRYSPPSTPSRAGRSSPPLGGRSSTPLRNGRTSPAFGRQSLDGDSGVSISSIIGASPRGTPRRHRMVSASQLNGGLYAPGTVDGLSEELEGELVLGGELVVPDVRERQYGGRI